MERLAAEDRLMLWPDRLWPQEIGAVALLDGEELLDGAGRFRLADLQRAIAARLHLIPRFRQVLCEPRLGLGGPLWSDALDFDIAHHVHGGEVAAPGDEAALMAAIEQRITRRLDQSGPLWEMCFFTGLADRQVALLIRMHHAIADGIAGVATLGAIFDSAPRPMTGPPQPWAPTPRPRDVALFADNVRRRAAALGAFCEHLARPVSTARAVRNAAAALRRLFGAPASPRTSLDRTVGPGRRVATIRGSLDAASQIGHQHGATVNDVLLAITAAGLRALFSSRGELTANLALPVYVPVTLSPVDRREPASGNMIGQSVVSLPVGESDPSRRLERIAVATAAVKSRPRTDLGTMFKSRLARGALLAFLDRHPVSVTTANIPGPRDPAYLATSRLLAVFPLLPLIGNVTIGVGALSYAGQFNITVVTDRDAVPDADVFVTAAEGELRGFIGSIAARTSSPR